jgi:hypothetical protein
MLARKVERVVAVVAPVEIESSVAVALHTGLPVPLASLAPYLSHNYYKIALRRVRKSHTLGSDEMT